MAASGDGKLRAVSNLAGISGAAAGSLCSRASATDAHFPLGSSFSPGTGTGRAKHNFMKAMYKFVPLMEWLPAYRWHEDGMKDLSGGLTLGCILVAQSLAHAELCKVSPINGPYSCILPPILYSFFGTCVHSSVGTGGLVSLLTGEQLTHFGDTQEERTRASAIFTLLVGIMITLMGVFRLAFLVRFLSRPALSGFITASALLIMASQLKPMVGLPKSDVGGLLQIAVMHPGQLEHFSPPTVVFSLAALLFIRIMPLGKDYHQALKRMNDFKELILLAGTALAAVAVPASLGQISIVGEVPSGLPSVRWPLTTADDFNLVNDMIPGAFLVALVTFLSSFAGAKKFAMKAGYQVVAMNELLALGVANLGGALNGAVPTQIGLSRMGIAYSAGVKSQLGANLYVAVVVMTVLQLFSGYIGYVPKCTLSVIILNGASHLTEFDHMRWLWSLRSTRTRQRTYIVDFAVWWVACIFTLHFGAFKGILAPVGVSLLLILYQVADPPITVLGWAEAQRRWMSMKVYTEARHRTGILVFRLEGPLFYANIERLQEWLAEMEVVAASEGQPLRALIFSAAAVPFVDTTALEALRQTIDAYHQRNVAFLVANASGQPQRILRHALADLLPHSSLDGAWNVEKCVAFLADQEEWRCRGSPHVAADEEAPTLPENGAVAPSVPPAEFPSVSSRASTSVPPTGPPHASSDEGRDDSSLSARERRSASLGRRLLPDGSSSNPHASRGRSRARSEDGGFDQQVRPLLSQAAWVANVSADGGSCSPRQSRARSAENRGRQLSRRAAWSSAPNFQQLAGVEADTPAQ